MYSRFPGDRTLLDQKLQIKICLIVLERPECRQHHLYAGRFGTPVKVTSARLP
jgi:hypothetical protein